jgi:acyl-CoA thioesterase II
MGTALDKVLGMLDLEQLEVNLFRGASAGGGPRNHVFGGLVLAQALIAAGRTVADDRHVHSMHCYFLRLGDPAIPIVFEVDRIRDGGSFTTRRVVAIQHGEAIFNMATSFHRTERGPEHEDPMPDVPGPEELGPPPDASGGASGRLRPVGGAAMEHERPVEILVVSGPLGGTESEGQAVVARPPDQDVWIRTNGDLPDDPLLHAAMVAYASDMTLLSTATLPHRATFQGGEYMIASLDHVMWFHRPLRADVWLLFRVHSPSAGGARGFANGSIFTPDGHLAVSIAQEGLLRPLS